MPLGTRFRTSAPNSLPQQGRFTRDLGRDPGAAKAVSASVTFAAGQAQAADGTFAAFVVGDLVLVQSTDGSQNAGSTFLISGVDATNAAYLDLDPSPIDEGPFTMEMRTQ